MVHLREDALVLTHTKGFYRWRQIELVGPDLWSTGVLEASRHQPSNDAYVHNAPILDAAVARDRVGGCELLSIPWRTSVVQKDGFAY